MFTLETILIAITWSLIHESCGKQPKTEKYFDLENLSTYPDGSCDVTHFTCVWDGSGSNSLTIKAFNASSPYDCCKTCLSMDSCKSWVHYYNGTQSGHPYMINDNPICVLYANSSHYSHLFNITDGNCVYGSEYQNYESKNKRENFVLFYPDTIRAEYLTPYNKEFADKVYDTTPNLNKFGNNGVISLHHYAQHSECSPSRCAMLTGRYMHTSGIRTLTNLIQPWDEYNYLRWMKDSGYYVLWIGKNDALAYDAAAVTLNEWVELDGLESGDNVFNFGEEGYFSMLYTGGDVYGNDTKNEDYNAVIYLQEFLSMFLIMCEFSSITTTTKKNSYFFFDKLKLKIISNIKLGNYFTNLSCNMNINIYNRIKQD